MLTAVLRDFVTHTVFIEAFRVGGAGRIYTVCVPDLRQISIPDLDDASQALAWQGPEARRLQRRKVAFDLQEGHDFLGDVTYIAFRFWPSFYFVFGRLKSF